MKKGLFTLALSLLLVFAVQAQVQNPAPSPKGTVTQDVGLSTITIEYSRPGVKNRLVFGDLVPYGEMWRTGANASTKVTFSEDVKVEGQELAAGTYALYTIPGEAAWDIVFYKETNHWGIPDAWSDDNVALKVSVEPYKVAEKIETLSLGIEDITNSSATLALRWENTVVPVGLTLETEAAVEASIAKTMAGPTANDYLQAARYYNDAGKELAKALEYINKADAMNPGKFWLLRTKSQIQAKLGDYKGAIATAEKSKALAQEAGNAQYVKFNEEAIEGWSKRVN